MDKLYEDTKKFKKKKSLYQIKALTSRLFKEREKNKHGLAVDLSLFALGFVLTRCHLLFGVRPVGLSLLCAMPDFIWPTLMGSVLGGISLGGDGTIFAVASAVAIFLRVALGYSESHGLFQEALTIRMAVATICGFVCAVFELLFSGLSEKSLLFGIFMIILSPILTFIFSGLFTKSLPLTALAHGNSDVFSLRDKDREERLDIIFFQIALLMLLFFVGLSFRGVDILGISISYIFSGCATLIAAKRFGAIRGMAVGFASSLGISGVLAVSFALAGLASGGLFALGTGYALIGGGIGLCAFSAYSVGLTGLLATLPEYVISSAVIFPFLKQVKEAASKKEDQKSDDSCESMVGTMALAYQNGYRGSVEKISPILNQLSSVIKSYTKAPGSLTEEEYRGVVIGVAERHCIGCESSGLCMSEGIRPCIKNSERIAKELLSGKKITADSINTDNEFCALAGLVADSINRESAKAERDNYLAEENISWADEFDMISTLLARSLEADASETSVDPDMTPILNRILDENGIIGTARIFGGRKKHLILACEDEKGDKITSKKLRLDIEKAIGVKLGSPEYFRKGNKVLMECTATRRLSVSVATAAMAGSASEISGDSISFFEGDEDYYYALISDGMGSGEIAKETSLFVSDFLKNALRIGVEKETVIHILNRVLKARREECSATVDLFELDMLLGSATFIKSGAAPSFVKRGSSIFRIRSQTTPIGLLSNIDSERIKVDIKPGDLIIMLSDGVADEADDAPWLLLLLGEPCKDSIEDYARLILSEAKRNVTSHDDMSVAVIKIDSL